MINIKKFRIFWIIALILVVFVLFWLKIVPGGEITYIKEFGKYSDFISNLTPSERILNNIIIGDPAYFTLRIPRRFEKVKLTLKFKNNSAKPIIEAGVLINKEAWNYDIKPLDNSILDQLSKKWDAIRSGDLLLLQREKKFQSVEDFLNSPLLYKEGQGEVISPEKIATYNYSPKIKFTLPDYESSQQERTFCRPIQGAYQFYTYIKNENLSFDFSLQDLNKNDDVDDVDILVYYNDQEIYKDSLLDDGGDSRELKLFLANLPEGVYKISLRANNDIVTRAIKTPQSKISFINKVILADTPEVSCGRNLFTNSRALQFQTVLSDKLGTVKINEIPLPGRGAEGGEGLGVISTFVEITETYKQFSTREILPKFSEIIMPSDGITISGDGLFSFSQEDFFDPEIKKINANFDAGREGVDYIIAKYTSPIQDGEWKIATADFDITNAYEEFDKHTFLISVPGLKAEDEFLDGVEVGEIKIELEGTSLFGKIKKMLNL